MGLGTVQCVADSNLNVNRSSYTLGGVGHTKANVSLVADYTAIIDRFNPGTNTDNPVESHTSNF